MTFKFKALVAAVALSAVALSASAGPINETISNPTPNVIWTFSGDQDAWFDFTIGAAGTYELDINATITPPKNKTGSIDGFSLWSGNSADPYIQGSRTYIDAFAGGSKSLEWVYDFASAGKYSLYVNSSSSTFPYAGSIIATSAVPEPETYAMMLAGLGALGFMARRRKQG